jgi:hypothetical protein
LPQHCPLVGRILIHRRLGRAPGTIVAILGAVCLLPCCGGVQWDKREWSRPAPLNQDGWTLGSDGDLVGPGLRVKIEPHNDRKAMLNMPLIMLVPFPPFPTWKSLYASPFVIEMGFTSVDEGFMFDPREVTLQFGDGPMIKSSGFRLGCSYRRGAIETVAPFRLIQWGCVSIEFDRQPPAPSQPFTLVIEGLEHDRLRVHVPPIKFEGASESWHGPH